MKFTICANYKGYDHDYDKKLAEKLGREDNGTGYCFLDGLRDVMWEYSVGHYALKAAKKLASLKKIRNVSISITDDDDYRKDVFLYIKKNGKYVKSMAHKRRIPQ